MIRGNVHYKSFSSASVDETTSRDILTNAGIEISATPVITYAAVDLVKGTCAEADGTPIYVKRNGLNVGVAVLASGEWSLAYTATNGSYTATSFASGKQLSYTSAPKAIETNEFIFSLVIGGGDLATAMSLPTFDPALALLAAPAVYNATVDWGDGVSTSFTAWNDAGIAHTYGVPGTYRVAIKGTFQGWNFEADTPGVGKDIIGSRITQIISWGTDAKCNNYTHLKYCMPSGLVSITSPLPFISGAGTLRNAFFQQTNLTNLSGFANANLTGCTSMRSIFNGCSALTSLNGLNWTLPSSLTSLAFAFQNTTSLTDISAISSWTIPAACTEMNHLFYGTAVSDFSPLNSWVLPAGASVYQAFQNTVMTVAPGWNAAAAVDCYACFYNSTCADWSPLANWGCAGPTSVDWMFSTSNFTDGSLLNGWVIGPLMNKCFSPTTLTSTPVWNTSATTAMNNVFNGATLSAPGGTAGLASWDVSNVTSFTGMFNFCDIPDATDLNTWSPTASIEGMFANSSIQVAPGMNYNLTPSVSYLFDACALLDDVSHMSGANPVATSYNYMFNACSALVDASAFDWILPNSVSVFAMFNDCSSLVNCPTMTIPLTLTSAQYMFTNCISLVDASPLTFTAPANPAQVTLISMFSGCTSLTTPPLVMDFSATSVPNFTNMFSGCTAFTNPDQFAGWLAPTLSVNATWMFQNSGITGCPNWDMGNTLLITADMFDGCAAFNGKNLANVNFPRELQPTLRTPFTGAGAILTAYYDAALIAWDAKFTDPDIAAPNIDFNGAQYTPGGAAETARTSLIAKGMTFTNDSAVGPTAPAPPVSYWNLNEASGTTLADGVGANNLTVIGSVTVGAAGLLGNCINVFDLDGGATKSSASGIPTSQNLTYSLWMKTTNTQAHSGNGEVALLYFDGDSFGPVRRGVGYKADTNVIFLHTGAAKQYFDPSKNLRDGAWHHIVGVFDYTASELSVYVDGVFIGPVSQSIATFSPPFFVRLATGNSVAPFLGSVDDVGIFDYKLSQTDVDYFYNGGTGQTLV